MSHFTTFVIARTDGLEMMELNAVELLAPFDEDISVDEYEKPCYCINSVADNDAAKTANEQVEHFGSLRDSFYKNVQKQEMTDEEKAEAWIKHIENWKKVHDKAELEHPMYNLPDPECEACQGTGMRKTTYNPLSKWDWYCVGGRWNGMFDGDNICTVKHWFERKYEAPFALLEPDGTWNEKGDMGWWAIVSGEKKDLDWEEEVFRILNKYVDGYYSIMLYDLHI